MRTVPWRQAATAWVRPSDLDLGVNNSHHQNRADAVVCSSCIGPCSCSNRSNPTRSRLPPFAMFITAFDMGSHDVLQVLGRSGRVNVARGITTTSTFGQRMLSSPLFSWPQYPRISRRSINGLITSPAALLEVLGGLPGRGCSQERLIPLAPTANILMLAIIGAGVAHSPQLVGKALPSYLFS